MAWESQQRCWNGTTFSKLSKYVSYTHPALCTCLIVTQSYYVSNIFYAITLGLIKCSATCFVANLTVKNMGSLQHAPKIHLFTLYGVVALCVAWTIGSAVTLGLPCEVSPPLVTSRSMCMGTVRFFAGTQRNKLCILRLILSQVDRWAGIFAGDAISDLAIVVYAASVIWRTQASVSKRLVWYIPFSVRLW